MKNISLLLLILLLSLSVAVYAQHMGGGMMGQGHMGQGPNPQGGMGQGTMGNMGNMGNMGDMSNMGQMQQMPMTQSQMHSGAFQMLQQRTGMNGSQLQQLYNSSGAQNFDQFGSAIVASKNLGLNYQTVLAGMKGKSLGQTLQSMGVSREQANVEIQKAHQSLKNANTQMKKSF